MPSIAKTNRKSFKWIVIAAIAVVFVLSYKLFDPSLGGYFPPCIFHSLTEWECPGCGSQRALHHLLNFDFRAAFAANPLLISAIPYILLAIVFDYIKNPSPRQQKIKGLLFGKTAIFILFVIVVAFGIWRNMH